MALPTCECVKGLPIGEQLAAIYCATYTLAQGDVDGPYLLKSANLSDVTDPDVARGNISAAESGANTDITSLGGVLNIGSGGVVPSAATYPKVVAYPSNSQTLTGGGTTDIIAFGTEIIDTANAFAANAFTVPATAAGYYFISLSTLYFQSGSDANINVAAYVNGSSVRRIMQPNLYSGTQDGVSGGVMVELSAGDVVTIRATQFAGTPWEILGGVSSLSCLNIFRIF